MEPEDITYRCTRNIDMQGEVKKTSYKIIHSNKLIPITCLHEETIQKTSLISGNSIKFIEGVALQDLQ